METPTPTPTPEVVLQEVLQGVVQIAPEQWQVLAAFLGIVVFALGVYLVMEL